MSVFVGPLLLALIISLPLALASAPAALPSAGAAPSGQVWNGAALRITDLKNSYPAAAALQFLEDAGGQLTVRDVQGADVAMRFRPVNTGDNEVNFGYSRSAYWLRLPVAVESNMARDWFLEVGFSSLDRISVFQVGANGRISEQSAGDLAPFAQRPVVHRNFVFPVVLNPRTSNVIFLRVESAGTLTIPVTLWESRALMAQDQSTYSLLSVYYGMLLALLLYNLMIYFATQDRVFLNYVVFVFFMAIGQASINGFGNQFMWPEFPAWGNIALPSGMALTGLCGAIFTRSFLGTKTAFARIDRVLVTFGIVFIIAAIVPTFISYRLSAMLTSFTGLAFGITAVAIGVYCDKQGHPGARYFLIAWTLLLLGVAVLAARNFGWLPTNTFTTYSMQIGSALELVLLSFALSDRLSSIRREKELATRETLITKQRVVDALQTSARELESRFVTRTRELEASVQSLREKEQQLGFLASHDQLTGLANRTLFYDRIAQSLARIRRNGGSLGIVMVDIDNFKVYNDQFGHAAGDRMLVAVADALRASVRAIDTVARWGGDEFVVLVDEVTDVVDVETVAVKLLKSMQTLEDPNGKAMPAGTAALSTSISIGVATFPEHGVDAHTLLVAADLAMYRAKAAGKNQWRWASGAAR